MFARGYYRIGLSLSLSAGPLLVPSSHEVLDAAFPLPRSFTPAILVDDLHFSLWSPPSTSPPAPVPAPHSGSS